MISICSVILKHNEKYKHIFLESIEQRLSHVSHVYLARVDKKEGRKEYKIGNINVLEFATKCPSDIFGHCWGMHKCIDKVQTKYLLMSDPDLFYYQNADEFYLEKMHKHNLKMIGISHHAAMGLAMLYFPCAQNALIKKENLPPKGWMSGQFDESSKYDGYYLMEKPWFSKHCNPKNIRHKFPNKSNPDPGYDVGSSLYLWMEENNWKWLSFNTMDTRLYRTGIYKTNFKLREKFKNKNLVYHQTGACEIRNAEEAFANFMEQYDKSKED